MAGVNGTSSIVGTLSIGNLSMGSPSMIAANMASPEITKNYAREYNLISKNINSMDKLATDVTHAIHTGNVMTSEKHVHVLLKTSSLCRELGGVIGILCKSGKDRTSMGVTLDMARGLNEASGVTTSTANICQLLRLHGTRRANVYANTGHITYAFNFMQRSLLPVCFKPPHGSFSGGET